MVQLQLGPEQIRSYRRLAYTPWHALAEFVDNSTQSYFDHKEELDRAYQVSDEVLEVSIVVSRDGTGMLRITDNAMGMSLEELQRALRVGVPPDNATGALVGALLAWAVWWVTRPPILVTWLLGALGAATAAAQASALSVAWPWQLLAASVGINQSAPSTNAIATSLPVEALFGPLVLVVARHGVDHWWRTIQGQEWARARAVAAQKKALERGWPGPDGAKPPTDNGGAPGVIRLGALAEDGRPFDIAIGELGQHVFLPGASGTGKTMTIARHNTEVYAPSQSLCLTRWIFYGMNLHTKLDLTFAGADCTQMERPLAGDLLSYLTH